MITLTQINGDEITVNAELIETIERSHDTIVTLTTARRLRVQEGIDDIIGKVVEYKRKILAPNLSAGQIPSADTK